MMTVEELNALIAILNRTPLTPAEALWLKALIERLQTLVSDPAKR